MAETLLAGSMRRQNRCKALRVLNPSIQRTLQRHPLQVLMHAREEKKRPFTHLTEEVLRVAQALGKAGQDAVVHLRHGSHELLCGVPAHACTFSTAASPTPGDGA